MAKVLLTWELGAELGHCVKLAPLAGGLVARGHEVYFAARDVATAQQVLQNSAVKFLQSPSLVSKLANVPRQPRTLAQILDQVGFGEEGRLRALVGSWRNLLELVRPGLIVCEHSPSALLASRWSDARRVVIGTGFSLPPDVSPMPDLCPWLGPSPVDPAEQETRLLQRVNRLLTEDHLAPLERLSRLYADADEAFLMTFRELDHHRGREPAEYWGSWAPRGGIEPDWPEGDGLRVFVYLKPAPGPFHLETVLSVLRELPVHALVYVPRASRSWLAYQTPSLRIGAEPVNLSAALQRCDMAVLNGTAGTAAQCLLAGVPLLMLPLYLEQFVFSRRVVELGAGVKSEPNRVELLAGRLWRGLQDDRHRRGASAFANRYADYDAHKQQQRMLERVETLLADDSAASAPRCQPALCTATATCG